MLRTILPRCAAREAADATGSSRQESSREACSASSQLGELEDQGVEESWTCGRCTYHNGLGRDACVLCGCGRDGGECESRAASDEASAQNASQEVTLFAVLPCRRILHGAIRGVFALVGSFAGALAGAVAAQSSRGGLVRGIGLGALAGAIVSVEALDASQVLLDGASTPSREDRETDSDASADAGRSLPSALGVFSRMSGIQIRLFNWGLFSVESGLDYALRELRLPPDVLLRMTSNTNRFSYPTSDLEDGGPVSLAAGSRRSEGAGAKGLSADQLRAVPYTTTTSSQVGQCAICFETFKAGEHVRVLPHCNHVFHARCLDPWLLKKGSCPMCRCSALSTK